jgi:hypothetical protein
MNASTVVFANTSNSVDIAEANGLSVSVTNIGTGTITVASPSDDISVGLVSGTVVTLDSAAGAVSNSNLGTSNVAATSLTANSDSGVTLDTTIITLTAADVSETGVIDISNNGALGVINATTKSGTINIGGASLSLVSVTSKDGNINLTADKITSNTGMVNSPKIDIDLRQIVSPILYLKT